MEAMSSSDSTSPTLPCSPETAPITKRQRTDDLSDLTPHDTLFAMPLSVVIFGATGDLAKKKLFPALHQLGLQGHIPRDLNIVGYGRSPVEMQSFLSKQCVNVPGGTSWSRDDYFERISFHAGGYDAAASYEALDEELARYEKAHPSGKPGNRLFFLSVPPSVFGTVAKMIAECCRAPHNGFTRLMIEKPFGRDSATFDDLNSLTARHFKEVQLFRIDHYLGKEVILNLPALVRSAASTTGPLAPAPAPPPPPPPPARARACARGWWVGCSLTHTGRARLPAQAAC